MMDTPATASPATVGHHAPATLLSVDPGTALLFGLLFAVLMVAVWGIATFNRFVTLRQQVRESWAGIDVELKRRYDLIPNLLAVVKGYAAHERETLELVVRARAAALASTGPADTQARDEEALASGLKRLFAVAEAYPALKADEQFRALQTELADTEDRIAAARRFFNGNTRDLNALRQSFPSNLIASMMSIQAAPYFELSDAAERVVPRV